MCEEIHCKVAVIGKEHVGKTSIIKRWIENEFDENNVSTIGTTKMSKTIEIGDKRIEIILMDTAGQEVYMSMADFYIRDVNLVMLCLDPSENNAKEGLIKWKEIADKYHPPEKMFLVSTKYDVWHDKPPLLIKEIKMLLKEIGVKEHFITSALTGYGIDELFQCVGNMFLNSSGDEMNHQAGIDINSTQSQEKKCC
ncbi:Ras-related protein Rab-6B [Tritrichomonas foetus]|uniref:Ras-related protein Rab-6B n=1 Tax=Tritrichomonas foetus TaxID=1144522 RepID=A0A1J4K175_9EUKA|nr:Ras-related protein Rab-6B [Tritrichomonas foetus]|eukprot:OHT04987.1 Ras-related protein Rab-6B [Tritrichomonas foetus]